MAQERLTTQELMFIEEHLRSTASVTKLLDYASQVSADPEIKSLCDRLAKDHRSDMNAYSAFVGARPTLQ
ncbi:MAG: hypothetical protein PWR07_1049 [Bacillota bacterium]|nr:hypothetical protein [Bacillota bacterium]